MDKQTKRYYKEHLHGGRNTAAQVADGMVLRIVALLACYLWYQSNVKNQVLALGLTGVTFLLMLLALGIYRGLAFDKFVLKERERIRNEVLRERLLLLDTAEYRKLCERVSGKKTNDTLLWCAQTASEIDENGVLSAYRAARAGKAGILTICSLSPITDKAAALITRLPVSVTCFLPHDMLKGARELDGYSVSDEDIEAYIKTEQVARDKRRKRMQAKPFASGSTKKYVIAAAILLAASFVTGYALYYRMLAGLCFSLAATAFLLNRPINHSAGEL